MVEIIPKPTKKLPSWQNLLLYFSVTLLIVVVLAYASLFYFEKKLSLSLDNLEEKIGKASSKEDKSQELSVISQQRKIEDFSRLFLEHQNASQFFQFLEKITHPKVWFSKLELDVVQSRAQISGQADNFKTLGQQVLIFQKQSLIQNTDLSGISIGKEGNVDFTVFLSLNPSLFKFSKE